MQQYQLDIAGVRTPCYDSAEQGTTAVVFVHGNPGSGDDWLALMSLASPFVRCLAPDLPGFGSAAKPQDFDYTVAGDAAHLEALLAARGIERVHLVLQDFGGPWGLAWAAAHPERIASIALFNIGIMRGYRWHYMARLWRTPLLGELVQATTTRTAFRLSLKHGNPRGLPSEFIDRTYNNYDRGTRRAVLKLYRATRALDDAANAIQAALRPRDLECLVMWGKCDPYVSWRFAEQQRETFPRAELVYFDDSGHWPFIDNPDAVAAVLVPFLQRVVNHRL